jgi:hypothetical protein
MNWPAFVCFTLICWRRASAGGQLEHPSEVKSSTIATDDDVAFIELAGEAACDFTGSQGENRKRKRESKLHWDPSSQTANI